jgi:hypothetical protein
VYILEIVFPERNIFPNNLIIKFNAGVCLDHNIFSSFNYQHGFPGLQTERGTLLFDFRGAKGQFSHASASSNGIMKMCRTPNSWE